MVVTAAAILGPVATFSAITLFFTGIPIVWKIIRKGNSSEASFFPFLSLFCCSSLWLKYGLIKGDSTLVFTNSIGCLLMFIYMTIFYFYTFQRSLLYKQILLGISVLFPTLYMVQQHMDSPETALFYLGFICSIGGVIAAGSPLSALADVLRTKSTATMAFPLCCGNFIVCVEWLAYGLATGDKFIQVPNFLGTILAIIQLLLFYLFPAKSPTYKTVINT